MTEVNERAAIGGNNPPDEFALVAGDIEDLFTEAEGWLDGEPVATQGQADALQELIVLTAAAAKRAESIRKEMVAPLDKKKAAIQDRFNPLIGKPKADGSRGKTVQIIETCNRVLTPWKNKLRQEAEVEAKRLREEAEVAAAEARAKLQSSQNLIDQAEAEATIKAAKKMTATAKKIEAAPKGTRTVWQVEIADPVAAMRYMWKTRRADMEAHALMLAKQDVAGGKRKIEGFKITSEEVSR